MSPFGPQLAASMTPTSAIAIGLPPASATFFSLPCDSKPTQAPSGEKNGSRAQSGTRQLPRLQVIERPQVESPARRRRAEVGRHHEMASVRRHREVGDDRPSGRRDEEPTHLRRWRGRGESHDPATVPTSAATSAAITADRQSSRAGRRLAVVVVVPECRSESASSANARSRADWNRRSGGFSTQRWMIRRSAGATAPASSGGSDSSTALTVAIRESRRKAGVPAIISWRTAPKAKISVRWSTGSPRTCSGAI